MVPEGYVGASVWGVREGVGYQRWPNPTPTSQSDGAAGGGGGGGGGGHAAISYAGVFKKDVPEGLGCWEFADGAEYWGSCCAGAPHGWYLTSHLTSPLTTIICQASSRRGGALRQLRRRLVCLYAALERPEGLYAAIGRPKGLYAVLTAPEIHIVRLGIVLVG